jgi:hypothetical protein
MLVTVDCIIGASPGWFPANSPTESSDFGWMQGSGGKLVPKVGGLIGVLDGVGFSVGWVAATATEGYSGGGEDAADGVVADEVAAGDGAEAVAAFVFAGYLGYRKGFVDSATHAKSPWSRLFV